jgi:UTP--glucose-1-phosphate uridylyltransferase
MKKITTAVIPAAGYGRRLLPITKSIPKEMLPINNKPICLHVVEEAVASGIEHIIFVISNHKHAIEEFFSPNELFEDNLLKEGYIKELQEIRQIQKLAKFTFVHEQYPYGNGGAISAVKHLIDEEAFVVVWPDELFITPKIPRIKQCIDTYYKYKKPVISAIEIKDQSKLNRYGIAKLKDIPGEKDHIKEILKIVEKPTPEKAPSNIATHGAYVLPKEIFAALEMTPLGKNGELWLTDAINILKKESGLLAKIILPGEYYDCGSPEEYLSLVIHLANKI